ncbi:phytanoyl-CoA dioxygenase family protein [Haliangium ochraceum]|uniref:Phytanoyl-CoA dioxygenase n=1 Tax=Haliangium ochraceum (strain DSM 14365 / JCM 11303 / SMP-2) TaxID=502025 RepID=D0LNF9_HALO1|nr:phytanoyl-CoA dioxygenase family protein [Haliangium ochraceum]ACY15336.1 Phytanoyl-CoA dioxygenase [Haliangium ochraceum DSM 14365]
MTPTFDLRDPQARERARSYFDVHGYAVIDTVLAVDERAALRGALEALWARCASEQSLPVTEYLDNISQWRDLWRHETTFAGFLADPRSWQTAALFMGQGGARLLHDHVIAKPAGGSGAVPWHQDQPYWPVDIDYGVSCWCPLEDVGPDGGCLEVIDGSHRWGQSPPVDFIRDEYGALDTHTDRVELPLSAGGLVVLHSLTWHRSRSNRASGVRPAYITLWLPPDARYAPEQSPWHPVNEHVTVARGEVLDDDWFPCHGDRTASAARPRRVLDDSPSAVDGLSMFNASKMVASQLRAILARADERFQSEPSSIDRMLTAPGAIAAIVRESIESGVVDALHRAAMQTALERLRIASEAYRLHRARNVYNGAYVEWWRIAGAAWETHLERAVPAEEP